MLELIGEILGIVVVNLVLSGDNAVVIGMASRRLSPHQRHRAIVLGGAAAVGLRVIFTALAALLLRIPLLEAAGGLLLLWIAYKLLRAEEESTEGQVREGRSMLDAVRTIVVADLVMSLDNILAVAGVAHGHTALLILGLVLSIPIILAGSNLVAVLMDRFPWLVWIGAGILAYSAGGMIVDDRIIHPYIAAVPALPTLLPVLTVVLVVAAALVDFVNDHRTRKREEQDALQSQPRDVYHS